MREILFRGKRIDSGEWSFGNLVIQETDNSEVNFITNNETVVDVFIQPIKKVWDTHWNSFGRQERKAVSPMLKVDPATIGQYTGLTDKNGEKIFEGDIMEFEVCGILCRGVVIIDGGNTGVFCKEGSPFLDDAIKRHDSVKIGNIHDNPELLNKEA